MAFRDRDGVGSSVSMLGSFQAGGDAIPREYHRKVLKKIAQLTKVIYTLNTKNDEHEQYVARLKATHDQDIDGILSDCTHKLQQCEEKLHLEKEASESKVAELRQSLVTAEEERRQLLQQQETYKTTVEERVGILKAHHSDNLESLNKQLKLLKSDQAQQLKELGQFRTELSKNSGRQLEESKARHQREITELQQRLQQEFVRERGLLEDRHRKEIGHMKADFEDELRKQELAAATVREEAAATEKRTWDEREGALRSEFSQREEQLNHQLSTLSADLRVARDSLALSEKKVVDLLSEFEDSEAGSTDVKRRLREAEEEVESLKGTLRETKVELEISREHYQQQSEEMKGMAGNIGRLEALCKSNEGVVGELQAAITGLEQRIKQLVEDKEALEDSRSQSDETKWEQIRALEKELEKIVKEKQDMRVQFAREIEAAQAQLGQREIELGHQHLEALQQLREESEKAALAAMKDQEAALEELGKRLQSQREVEMQHMKESLEGENAHLKDTLSDRISELELAQAELKRLEAELSKRERGLGSATDTLERLREELKSARGELVATRREKQECAKERDKLLSSVESLKGQVRELTRAHQDQVVRLKKEVTEEVENRWKEKLMLECAGLRQELLSRHKEDSKASLSELAELKDRALEKARGKWEEERERLLKQVSELEKRLQEMQTSNSALLGQVQASSESQIATLKSELEEQRARHAALVEEERQSHSKELAALGRRLAGEREELAASLGERHQKDKEEMQMANQMAVETMRKSLLLQGQQQVGQVEREYSMKMADLQVDLTAGHEREKRSLRAECEAEIQKHREQTERLLAERRNEVNQYERTVSSLNIDIEHRDAEASKLRDRVNSLTVGNSNLRKEVEVKGHEVLSVRRETNALLQQRTRELSAAHSVEMESLSTQHKHHTQMLLSEFNNAKALFTNKISHLETKVKDWERRYKSRDSKPEDLDMIRELGLLVEQHKLRIKDLIAEKRVYQLELMNREKNYNQVFNANPLVGVLDPLAGKRKQDTVWSRYPSAPSLMTPSLEPHPPPTTLASLSGPLAPHHSTAVATSSGQFFSRREHHQPTSVKTRKLMAPKNSPVGKQKFDSREKLPDGAGEGMGATINPLTPANISSNPLKHIATVQ